MEPSLQPQSAAPLRTWNSRLILFLSLVLVLFLHVHFNGYVCFRVDHQTQIPLIYMKHDPGLFQNDWFLTRFAHTEVRKFHLLLIETFAKPLGLPGGILVIYCGLILATLWAWTSISRKLYGSPWPGLLMGAMAVFIYGNEIGTNHLLEKAMIPRTEAFAFAYWGLYFALSGPYALAGVLLGLGGYFQQAVGPLFAVPIFIWLLVRPGAPRRFRDAAIFIVSFAVVFAVPIVMVSHGLSQAATVSSDEEIRLAAFIRHPHHMVPHLWGWLWLHFAILLSVFLTVWPRLRGKYAQAWAFGWLAPIMIVLLAALTFFIEVLPVKDIIKAQPYRMAVLLYVVLLLAIAPHLLELLRRGDLFSTARAVLFILALQDCKYLALIAPIELLIAHRERIGRPLSRLAIAGWWAGALAIALVDYGELLIFRKLSADDDVKTLLKLLAAALVVAFFAVKLRMSQRPRLLAGLMSVVVAAHVVFVTSFFWFPYERVVENGKKSQRRKIGQLCWHYQFNPFPIMALERIGAWAQQNTPRDSLFIIPPGRDQEGFHIWAKRAVFFSIKFFPYNPQGLMEWRERFLAIHGIFDLNSPKGQRDLKEALSDNGAREINDVYESLVPETILQIANRYHTDYIITRAKYDVPFLTQVYQEYNRTKSLETGSRKPYRVYRIDLAAQAQAAPAGS